MKKLLFKFFALILTFSFIALPLFASTATAAEMTKVTDFHASKTELTLNEEHFVTFSVSADTTSLFPLAIRVVDDSGNLVAKLYDNGKGGDAIANDGVYSQNVSLKKTDKARTEVTYQAWLNNRVVGEWSITYYRLATEAEIKQHDTLWLEIESLERELKAKGLSNDEIFNTIYDFVANNPETEAIEIESDYSFSFMLKSGIPNAYTLYSALDRKSGDADAALQFFLDGLQKNKVETVTAADPDFILFRPYRNSPSMGDFANEFYSTIAQNVCNITGGIVNDLKESAAYPGNIINIADYGFFLIDSHGTTSGGKSYMIMRKGNTADYEYNTDLSAGHIISTGSSDVGVTGSFFTKYFQAAGKTLPGTMVYLVICLGMKTTAISTPLCNLGALLVVGYDESVSFTYDFKLSAAVWGAMVSKHPSEDRYYTFQEAMQIGFQQAGSYDPYTYPNARMKYQGNGNFSLQIPRIAIAGVSVSPASYELYNNNAVQLALVIEPESANNYTYEWRSDNENVATVDQSGLVVAHSKGTAQITCTVIDYTDEANPVTYFGTSMITSLGDLKVTGIEVKTTVINLYTDSNPVRIEAHVLPYNATNQALNYQSADTSVATVDETGWVSPVAEGTTVITVTTVDGGYSKNVAVNVVYADFPLAINATGGTLNLKNHETYPWRPDMQNNRMAVKCTNTGVSPSNSNIRLESIYLPANTVVSFDWKVSCEVRWDYLYFRVNGAAIPSIPDISGVRDWTTVTYTIPYDGTYTFEWGYTKDMSQNANDDAAWLDNIDVIIPGKTYVVKFFDKDDNVISTQNVPHGAAAVEPTLPNYGSGYRFVGWDKPFNEVRSDLEVRPIYEITSVTYTVTFVDYDGRVIDIQYVEKNKSAVAPQDPVREGHVFWGWDKDFSNIIEDTVITALYKEIGDANADNTINTGDAVIILRYVVGAAELIKPELGDFNLDGNVNTGDAAAILNHAIVRS